MNHMMPQSRAVFRGAGGDNSFQDQRWGLPETAIAKIEEARRKGIDVSMEQYPYTAGSTMLYAVFPPGATRVGPSVFWNAWKSKGIRSKKTSKSVTIGRT